MPKKLTIEQMQALAKKRGGKCLSKKYVNARTKLRWRCAEGHKWEAAPGMVKSGTWCPTCGGTLRGTIEQMQAIAKKRGGKCLSKEYVNAHTKLRWRCAKKHTWEADPDKVKGSRQRSGTWCPTCARSSRKA